MTGAGWIGIKEPGGFNPYVHWWKEFEAPQFQEGMVDRFDHIFSGLAAAFLQGTGISPALLRQISEADEPGGNGTANGNIPLPAGTVNPDFQAFVNEGNNWTDGISLEPEDLPPDDAVVVGIIDAAIALGHQRFMRKGGQTTRFLAAWQQSAPHHGQKHLPFGRELLKPEIDGLLRDHSFDGVLDEEAFNDAAGLVDLVAPLGQRELNHNVAHGTHVLDLATGFDITDPAVDDDMLRRRPIIAVNLPNRYAIGSSGSFLEMFVIQAISRIVEVSDKIWSLREDGSEADRHRGYPIVINLSYGLHAGPKDGSMDLEIFLTNMIQQRELEGKAPVRIVLPAGNDNLERGNAIWTLQGSNKFKKWFPWRILPEDQTSNYLEIWSDKLVEDERNPLPLSIKVRAPDGTVIESTTGGVNSYLDIGDFARIYCHSRRAPISGWDRTGGGPQVHLRQRYVVCVAPTLASRPGGQEAPSGVWHIRIELDKDAYPDGEDVFVHVQSDQSTRPGGATGLLSYLDHPSYEVIGDDEFLLDTYVFKKKFTKVQAANQEPNNKKGPVQRKGTLNAIAALKDAVVVAGHRVSDMRPADYSATGAGQYRLIHSRPAPTLSYPSDDGPAHPGLLAAGSRSGSTEVMQGTSFATAQATRDIADLLETWPDNPNAGSPDDMDARSRGADPNDGTFGRIFTWKSGNGRMPGSPPQRMARRDPD